ncbi:phospho-N-acetylmuramoyl-pentapeptide-transferase [Helicobacter sp. 13S00401-1]|uniref:phospho-N-acetylmuramoyl-pentapeptide- transferase n=1 Tax=Helicobacter sp. 13S00401-1 TaxID=1905758 RepID=UPI000BA7C027|nr:phospho-N-acetylmuramoyl-pentapeptide-transferase [Helicobacter sp. 13S00401-1]PAF49019.1 phospho-N-acetylmuramoyl-pentapeptide-transferase [Helicobacter sp. 13S00401-1]
MLYYLYEYFDINLFQYITFRAGVSFIIGFLLSAFLLPKFIAWAVNKKASQPISTFIKAHEQKKNTPTMGGLVFVFSTLIASLLTLKLDNYYSILGMLCLLLFCLVGARDDYVKIAAKTNAGMSAKLKFFLLAIIALLLSLGMYYSGLNTSLYLPFLKHPVIDVASYPYIAIIFWMLVFLATTNAVNITDGLDGLATVPSICALASLSVFVYVAGNYEWSRYLFWPRVYGAGEVMVISLALIGSLFGFLWYNCHPAQVFMGDSGSLAIGGFVAYCAIIANSEILLIIIGFVFVIETLSVILQVGSFKLRKKRIFLMAPLHHHFEVKGWAENKIIVRFWIIAILSNILALLSLKIR